MTILGFDVTTGEPVELGAEARARGVYMIGATGTGKTTLLQSIAYQDMLAGDGVCVLDPHGDMIDWLLERVPPERVDDVILFDPSDVERPFGMNLLECEDREDPIQVRWVVSTFLVTLRRLFAWSWGPRLEHVLSNTLWTAMAMPGSTIIEVLLLLIHEDTREEVRQRLRDPLLERFWDDFAKLPARDRHELISSTVNKLTPFILDEGMRNIVGQTKSTFKLRDIMDERRILLVNLSKGDLGENNSSLLGAMLINMVLMAALSRRDQSLEQRQQAPFHVIVDEYQNFASESFSVLQSEARKYAVDLVVAHQFRDQLDDETRGAALNVGNFVSFRVTGVDGPELAMQFDNTPPQPDPVWEPHREPSSQFPGLYTRGQFDVQAEGPQRLYSDVAMQSANELANLVPFRARAKLIGENPKTGRLELQEYTFDTPDPRIPELATLYYGLPDQAVAQQIRVQSCEKADPVHDVRARILNRTQGRADVSNPPAYELELDL